MGNLAFRQLGSWRDAVSFLPRVRRVRTRVNQTDPVVRICIHLRAYECVRFKGSEPITSHPEVAPFLVRCGMATSHAELKLLAMLEPDHLAPDVCHWLAIAMHFQAMKAWRVGHRYVAQNSAGCPI